MQARPSLQTRYLACMRLYISLSQYIQNGRFHIENPISWLLLKTKSSGTARPTFLLDNGGIAAIA